jgi:argininosuccinate lyase
MLHKLLPKLKVTDGVFEKANANFVAATELANVLVRKYDMPFRTAHKIVGAFVKSLIDAKLKFTDSKPEMLQKAAADVANIKLNVQVEDLKALESPLALVKACKVKGGPAPHEVEKALVEWEKKLLLIKSDVIKLDKELEEAKNELEKTVKAQFSTNFSENVNLKNSNL